VFVAECEKAVVELYGANPQNNPDYSRLHDLGLTPRAPGPHRFEVEGASEARKFLVDNGVSANRAQKVWDNIALHTWDINLFRDDTNRPMELGVLCDVLGVPDAGLDADDVVKVVRRYPRLKFKTAFNDTLNRELDAKQPYPHVFHICSTIAHNRAPLRMPDASTVFIRNLRDSCSPPLPNP